MNLYNMTNQIIKKLFIATTLFVVCSVWGQNIGEPHRYNQTEKFYPKPPEVSSFEKFVNIPPGNYTGVHGYSVPIYTIQVGNQSFPISINYHGMGVNINEIASEVGLGWNLSIGDINLSQEIRGYDDFTSSKINLEKGTDFLSGNVQPHEEEASVPQSEQYWNAVKIAGGFYADRITYFLNAPPGQEFEFNPDYFSYALLNDNGKFIFDGNGIAQTVPKDNVSITRNGNNIVLYDSNGIKYTFERYHYSNNQSELYVVNESYSYKLQSIYFPDTQETMSFSYIETSYEYISNNHKFKNINISYALPNAPMTSHELTSRTYTDVISEFLVSKITYKDTEINFIYAGEPQYNNGRKDLGGGGKRLDGITVKFKPLAGGEKTIKNYKMHTSYVSDWLRLNSVEDLISETSYSFDYEDSKQLPGRLGCHADWWGSYTDSAPLLNPDTDADNQSLCLPFFIYQKYAGGPRKYFNGVNKEPVLEYAVTGALKKVNFPTGGFQEFHYELDEYKYDSIEIQYKPLWFDMEDWNSESSSINEIIEIEAYDGMDYRQGMDYRLTIGTNQVVCHGNSEDPGLPLGRSFYLDLYADGIQINRYLVESQIQYQLPEFDPNVNYYFKIYENGTFNPQICDQPYRVVITPHINWVHESEPIYKKNKNAGHLRVGAITLHDSNGDTLIKRSFEYKSFADKTFSSGVFTGIPINKKQVVQLPGRTVYTCSPEGPNGENIDPCIEKNVGGHEVISSNPALNLNSSFGKSVFYENVTEIYENLQDPSKSYRKELVFQLPSKEGYPEDKSPTTYWPHNEYTGGQLLEERIYNNTFNPNISDNTPSLVKKITNEYSEPDYHFNSSSFYYDSAIPFAVGFGVAASLESSIIHFCSTIGCEMRFKHDTNVYFITSGWVKLQTTKEENYENGVLKMTNTTNYEYSPTYNHLNPVSVTNTNSLGEVVKTEYYYPQDLTTYYEQSSLMNKLVNRNQISTPVITKTFSGTAPTSEQRIHYAHFYEDINDPSTGFILPQYVYAKKGEIGTTSQVTDRKITYDSYDAQGNLTQYTMENGTPVSIIWGYNGQYPIAKVEGKTYTDIASLAGTLITDSNSSWGLQATNFETLRNTTGAIVTCYIYQPLVGVTTIIQPNGQKETYHYDASGRLEYVKDHEGNILKKIGYNYKD